MPSRDVLEKNQVVVYLVAIAAGLAAGMLAPAGIAGLEILLWPLLGLLLYATFTQTPLTQMREAFGDMRFLAAAITGNFVLLPLAVWGLVSLLPADPALRLGVLLVLLVPCTDWFITFTHLGRGDSRRAIAFVPVSLLLQILLLPVYLTLFLGAEFTASLVHGAMFAAFFGLIVLPLCAAFTTERLAERNETCRAVVWPGGRCRCSVSSCSSSRRRRWSWSSAPRVRSPGSPSCSSRS